MPQYTIESNITTLAQIMVDHSAIANVFFQEDGLIFSQWGHSLEKGCFGDAWIAKLDIEASNHKEAYAVFFKKLKKIIPRLSLIVQCYVNLIDEPFLITQKHNRSIGFFHYSFKRRSCGLGFCEEQENGLKKLLQIDSIPEEFYYHWNDAVNVFSYPAKILSMCAAIEALTKENKGVLRKKILGEELRDKLFAQTAGLRHRLSHGEYFNETDDIDYVEEIHKKVIKYFNKEILGRNYISEDVVSPQRHIEGVFEQGNYFIKRIDEEPLDFRELVNDCKEKYWNDFQNHEFTSEPTNF
ncbi:hypothetical protein K9M59_00560 [Candidatus Gracilibacteria bacterium]|nr:hypothetical protein [Candidatus Gracilibacteria bacterium]MCF7819072.1 hypothetical protein [Candidatus Gracilibacteria bacterium]